MKLGVPGYFKNIVIVNSTMDETYVRFGGIYFIQFIVHFIIIASGKISTFSTGLN